MCGSMSRKLSLDRSKRKTLTPYSAAQYVVTGAVREGLKVRRDDKLFHVWHMC